MKRNLLNAPKGMKSYLPEQALKFEEIRKNVSRVFRSWGYVPIMTPLLEYHNSLLAGMGEHTKKEFYKLIDYDGNVLALRPEMTAPIARTVVNRSDEVDLPLRLSYFAPVYRYDLPQVGKNREIYQMGLEFIGDNSFADAEILITAIEAIKNTGIKKFKIDLGHVGYLQGIINRLELKTEEAQELKSFLHRKDFVGLRSFLGDLKPGEDSVLHELPLLRGDQEILQRAEKLVENEMSQKAVQKLQEIYQYLLSYDVAEYVNFDFSLIRGFDYYTGMIFEGFTEKLGYTICGGGRYDKLIQKYGGDPTPAVGFAIGVQRVALALGPKTSTGLDGILVFSPETRQLALNCARQLHKDNYRIIIEENGYSRDYFMEMAHRKGAEKVLLFSDKDAGANNQLCVIDVKTEKEKIIDINEGWEQKIWEK
ncbi:MAG: ATP phosphoribosyltransferase regulatory subunit [Bacillota bacterium]